MRPRCSIESYRTDRKIGWIWVDMLIYASGAHRIWCAPDAFRIDARDGL